MFLISQLWMDSFRANFSFILEATNGPVPNGGLTFIIQADNDASAGPNDAGIGYGEYTGGGSRLLRFLFLFLLFA
jgi:hypothetical protein